MSIDYEVDPRKIEAESFRLIRELTPLDSFDREQQQVAMRVVHSLGQPGIAASLRFSESACAAGMQALADECPILCDVEMVQNGDRILPGDILAVGRAICGYIGRRIAASAIGYAVVAP